MNHALLFAHHWMVEYGYFGLFGTVFVENFGIPLPGQSALMGGAMLARSGDMDMARVFFVAWSAAFSGDVIGYLIGRYLGRRVLDRLPVSNITIAKVDRAYARHGGALIVFSRFIEGFRQINGIIAGSLGMAWKAFLLFNAIGAFLWCSVWGLGLYYAADTILHLWQLMQPIHTLGWIATAILFITGIAYLIWRSRKNRSHEGI
ncbi:DedA family protein [Mariprofundus ferrooxydans]|uniref:DedA family protein n=1 Tax=Mariprofundus ferrooxydans TaxID=314344 RepID=UPI0014314329|nr:DedA family protein [Mariprofundus ferrooxydans]